MFTLMSGFKDVIGNACEQINQSLEKAQDEHVQYNGLFISTKVFWNYLEEGKLNSGVGEALCGEYTSWRESKKFGSKTSTRQDLFGLTNDGCPV